MWFVFIIHYFYNNTFYWMAQSMHHSLEVVFIQSIHDFFLSVNYCKLKNLLVKVKNILAFSCLASVSLE